MENTNTMEVPFGVKDSEPGSNQNGGIFDTCAENCHLEDEQNLNACLSYINDEPLRAWLIDAIRSKYDKPAEWTIEDAKNGDILVYEGLYTSFVLFKGIGLSGNGHIDYHAKYDIDSPVFLLQEGKYFMGTMAEAAKYYRPATKGEIEKFNKAMNDAGYMWDADKKEIVPLFEQDNHLHAICQYLHILKGEPNTSDSVKSDIDECINWLSSECQKKVWCPSDEEMDMFIKTFLFYFSGKRVTNILRECLSYSVKAFRNAKGRGQRYDG